MLFIMRSKFKQWWSSIPPMSTKQTITSHLNWTHWTQKRQWHDVGNPSPDVGQAQKCGRVKSVNGIPTLASWKLYFQLQYIYK
jgi:hypothetical protein